MHFFSSCLFALTKAIILKDKGINYSIGNRTTRKYILRCIYQILCDKRGVQIPTTTATTGVVTYPTVTTTTAISTAAAATTTATTTTTTTAIANIISSTSSTPPTVISSSSSEEEEGQQQLTSLTSQLNAVKIIRECLILLIRNTW